MVIARSRTTEALAWQDQQVLKLFGDLTLDGRRDLIHERVVGESLMKLLGTQPWPCVRYIRQFAELHAAIHHQRGIGLPPGLLVAALHRLARMPDSEMLCHFDFHPDQVMMTATDQVVLDWMTAKAGQPAVL
jgi:hypothetical protein